MVILSMKKNNEYNTNQNISFARLKHPMPIVKIDYIHTLFCKQALIYAMYIRKLKRSQQINSICFKARIANYV